MAAAKDGTANWLVDLVGTTDLAVKRPRTESHVGEVCEFTTNVEKTTDDAANSKATAKASNDPAAEAGKEAMVVNTQVKEVARVTGTAPT
jgi:hypothetical protein